MATLEPRPEERQMTAQANTGQTLKQTLDLGSVAGTEDNPSKSLTGKTREDLAELNRKYAQFYRETYLSKNNVSTTEEGEKSLAEDGQVLLQMSS